MQLLGGGEQDSNLRLETRIFPAFLIFKNLNATILP